ncbi:NTP transferase domain-containing protein [Gordonia desulfuricans]|uniref:NTP transferase domain-containing protein n=1 Tax=Gordonia desulfuricans TaxID=89051 RepID=A0A7K3LTB8_9ACTN|nr:MULTISPECIES: NTP transferase domain-containing protein [Gordonia]EMP12703.1 molybdopterin-guanine dinucleotide biosynthesis protein MobA [Gordonia sp. NB41Y]NDK91479.1 NTP transferase domain-containing protein [Gordonia desulfuricans]WLP91501.1 NTP transferase domain-containing protein [Gordonia sp. NB41Y]
MDVGAVLAAGGGRRFGIPKILAQQGEWLDIAVDALRRGGCAEVLVAMGAALVDPPPESQAVTVPDWAVGVSASVRAVLDHVADRPEMDGVVLHVVDTPDVGSDVVARIVATAGGRRDALVRAVYDGRSGHPVYLGADHLCGVRAVLAGDVGAQTYLRGRDDVTVVECGDLATGVDHDVPD